MKKIFTITALAAAMIAAATSCQKEQFAGQNANPQIQGEGLVFYASLENTDTKTTISDEGTAGYKISWEATDSISVNGTIYKAVPDGTNPAKATFVKVRESDPNPKAPFTAYYPASVYDSTAKAATLPATQVYKADGSIAGILPMYAESSDMNLSFKNLCGLMKFTLKGTEEVQYITITDDTKALSGKFTVSGNAAVLDGAATGGVSLDCGETGVLLDETTGKTFYVAVPAGSYDNLHIEYTTLNSAKYAKMKADGIATVARNKVYPFSQTPTFKSDWFYFEAVEAGATIGMSATGTGPTVSLKYSTDGGESWTVFTAGSTSVPLANAGDRVYFKAGTENTKLAENQYDYWSFTNTKNVNVGGNIMYLLNGETPGIILPANYLFYSLFACSKIISASDLKLPATKIKSNCYRSMFQGCTALVNAPALPATSLLGNCYQSMFEGCTALVNAPELPATTLPGSCYQSMFEGCTALVNAPELPATTFKGGNVYESMFQGCTALVNAPELPATNLKKGSVYRSMFQGCTALVNAPELPATTLQLNCYQSMFQGCTALVNAPELPATTLANSCYLSMFQGCTALVNAPELPATTLKAYCYVSMFEGCTALVNTPELPATTLADYCYLSMFDGCFALVNAPVLPATTLTQFCYYAMFHGDFNLSSVTMLATNVSAGDCLTEWLTNAGQGEGSHTLYVDPSMTTNATIIQEKGNFTVTAYTGK